MNIFLSALLLIPMMFAQIMGIGYRHVFSAPHVTFVSGTAIRAAGSPTVSTSSFTCGAGNYLYIFVGSSTSSNTFTVSTTSSNTITSVVVNTHAGTTTSQVFNVTSCNGTAGTYTLVCAAGNYCELAIAQFSHVTAVESTNTCFGGGYTATCSITTVAPTAYVVGSIMTDEGIPAVPLTGWLDVGNSLSPAVNGEVGLYTQMESTSGSKTMTPPNGSGQGLTSDTEIMVALK